MKGRPVLGFISGLLFGLFMALVLQQFGIQATEEDEKELIRRAEEWKPPEHWERHMAKLRDSRHWEHQARKWQDPRQWERLGKRGRTPPAWPLGSSP